MYIVQCLTINILYTTLVYSQAILPRLCYTWSQEKVFLKSQKKSSYLEMNLKVALESHLVNQRNRTLQIVILWALNQMANLEIKKLLRHSPPLFYLMFAVKYKTRGQWRVNCCEEKIVTRGDKLIFIRRPHCNNLYLTDQTFGLHEDHLSGQTGHEISILHRMSLQLIKSD